MESEVIYYCEDHEGVDYTALSEYFGKPEDVAKDFLSELGENALTRTNKFKHHLIYITILIVSMVTILVAGVSIYTDYKQQQALDVYYIEEITYEGELTPDIAGPTYAVDTYYSEEDILNDN